MSNAEPPAVNPPIDPIEPAPRGSDSIRRAWIWPFPPVSSRVAEFVRRVAGWFAPLVAGWRWFPASILAGAAPVLVSYFLRVPGHQIATALVLFPLFLSGIRAARSMRALSIVAVAFVAHSAVVIVLSARDPAGIAPLLPGAEPFWRESRDWIETGVNVEYAPSRWLPKHALLLGAVVLLGYCSVGLTVLLRGLYEVDLMNYYVGRLVAESSEAATAVIYGWHIWSLLRGVGCALIMYEISAVSLARLTHDDPAAGRCRFGRPLAGVGLLVLDGVLKFLLMDTVQARLQTNLL